MQSFWIYLINNSTVIDKIPDFRLRAISIQSLLYLPLFCFAIGKKESELIYKNIKFKYSINTSINDSINDSINVTKTINNDTLKFIGSSSQNLFFTDLKNSKIFILNNNIDTLILKSKE